MGKHFGNLTKMYGVVTYTVSPFEVRAFANIIKKGVPNMWRRFREQFFSIAPPFAFASVLKCWAEKANTRWSRKDISMYTDMYEFEDDDE